MFAKLDFKEAYFQILVDDKTSEVNINTSKCLLKIKSLLVEVSSCSARYEEDNFWYWWRASSDWWCYKRAIIYIKESERFKKKFQKQIWNWRKTKATFLGYVIDRHFYEHFLENMASVAELLYRLLDKYHGFGQYSRKWIIKWCLQWASYQYTITHRPSAESNNADALSRLPLPEIKALKVGQNDTYSSWLTLCGKRNFNSIRYYYGKPNCLYPKIALSYHHFDIFKEEAKS